MIQAIPAGPDVAIRRVQREDACLLFRWLNRPDSLAASLATGQPVPWHEHGRWLDERLGDPWSRLWIVECAGRPVGQVRLQDKGSGPEVALYVEAACRGRGIAAQALELALVEARPVWPDATALARVRRDNPRSRRFFRGRGFSLHGEAADHEIYGRTL